MRLQAALLPPQAVQEDLAALVASVSGSQEQLSPIPAHRMYLRLANFGKVATGDAATLHETLQRELTQWPRMRFRFRGGTALEPIGDDSAWANLDGELDQLGQVANLTVRVVKRLGFLVDRRLPRTRMRVGRITPATTVEYLQELVDALEGYQGPEWACFDLALLKLSDSDVSDDPAFDVLHRLTLSEHAPG